MSSKSQQNHWEKKFKNIRQFDVIATIFTNVSINSNLLNAKITIIMIFQIMSIRSDNMQWSNQKKIMHFSNDFHEENIKKLQIFRKVFDNEKLISRNDFVMFSIVHQTWSSMNIIILIMCEFSSLINEWLSKNISKIWK